MRKYTVSELPITEKPRERLTRLGAHALSDSELLAIVLRVGGKTETVLALARDILSHFDDLNGVFDASIEQLTRFKNIGTTKAITLKAVYELSTRINSSTRDFISHLKSPKEIYSIVRRDFHKKKKEYLWVISVDVKQRFIAKDLVSVGTIKEALACPREIYRHAYLRGAVAIILSHNHPSGDPIPSAEDIVLTEDVAQAGKILGIPLIDHVVVGGKEYSSMKAMNMFKTKMFDGGKEVKK
jgi:DNA repair protein RadC